MTKGDKRNFKLYAKRIQGDDSLMFIKLFDAMEKMSELDDKKALQKLQGLNKTQYSNLKRHLYSQILVSLRMISIKRDKAIEIREQIDFASILYAKGLFLQSLKLLQRARKIAEKEELDLLTLEIIEMQKVIESRHITNSGPLVNDLLTSSAYQTIQRVDNSIALSNMRGNLHAYYIRNSHIKTAQEETEIRQYFRNQLPAIKESMLSYPENVYLYQCYVWYHYILLDFKSCYENAVKWTSIFERDSELKQQDPVLYMRGYHYMLTAAFNARNTDAIERHLADLETFRKSNYSKFDENAKLFSFLYVHWARYNVHFLKGTFDKGLDHIPRTLQRIKRYTHRIAPHRRMVLYYKIAWMYMGAGHPGETVSYLSKILSEDDDAFREDIQAYSRLLLLMAHYDLDNLDLLPYLTRSTMTFFKNKTTSQNRLQRAMLKFFTDIQKVGISDRRELLLAFQKELQVIYQDPYELRAFLYLDVLAWVDAKINKQPIKGLIESASKWAQ